MIINLISVTAVMAFEKVTQNYHRMLHYCISNEGGIQSAVNFSLSISTPNLTNLVVTNSKRLVQPQTGCHFGSNVNVMYKMAMKIRIKLCGCVFIGTKH